MFEIPNDVDITKELAVDQLIRETEEGETYMWERKNYSTYTQYLFTHKLAEAVSICFRIHYYKTHDGHTLNIYMSRNHGMKYVSIFIVEGPKVLELIKVIEKTGRFYYEPE